MSRVPRMVVTDSGQKAAYHVISRTALDGLPFGKVEKDELVRIIQRFSAVYAVDVLGYAIMGNHFHLVVEVWPGSMVSDDEVRRRFQVLYGEEVEFPEGEQGAGSLCWTPKPRYEILLSRLPSCLNHIENHS